MRKAKHILITCLTILQVALAVRFAAAAPIAHGSFNGVTAPEYAVPGGMLAFSATAINDGDATGWFRICVIRYGPSYHQYFPNPLDQVDYEWAVHCSRTLRLDPGQRMTHESTKWRMMSLPNELFWVMLIVQQQAPVSESDDGSDLINMNVDEIREVVVTNIRWQA